MPSANLHSDLRSMWRRFHRMRGLQRAAFVVPAFEMRGASRKWPGDKEEVGSRPTPRLAAPATPPPPSVTLALVAARASQLVELVEGGQALPVHEEKLAAAHGATDYSRWYMAANAYEVRYQLQYEPYVMVHRDAPRYDDKFVGYGQDKVRAWGGRGTEAALRAAAQARPLTRARPRSRTCTSSTWPATASWCCPTCSRSTWSTPCPSGARRRM